MTTLQLVITALCLLGAVALVVQIVRDRVPGTGLLVLVVGIEVLLVVHLVLGVVKVVGAPSGVSVWEYVAYLVGSLLFLPAGVVWSAGERTRGGTGVLLVAVLVVPFLFVRLADIYAAGA